MALLTGDARAGNPETAHVVVMTTEAPPVHRPLRAPFRARVGWRWVEVPAIQWLGGGLYNSVCTEGLQLAKHSIFHGGNNSLDWAGFALRRWPNKVCAARQASPSDWQDEASCSFRSSLSFVEGRIGRFVCLFGRGAMHAGSACLCFSGTQDRSLGRSQF